MKHYLVFKIGRKQKVVDLIDAVSGAFKVSKAEAKRIIEQNGLTVRRLSL